MEYLTSDQHHAGKILHAIGYREVTDPYVWVPVTVLYSAYTVEHRRIPDDTPAPDLPGMMVAPPEEHEILTVGQIGRLVPGIFPNVQRVTRKYRGRYCRGWSCLTGPGHLESDRRY